MFDPTTNRIAHRMLTEGEREVLYNWEHGLEVYAGGWKTFPDRDRMCLSNIYRAKPYLASTTIWRYLFTDYRNSQWLGPLCRSRALLEIPHPWTPHNLLGILCVVTHEGVSKVYIEKV
jgi:hypothetical protein